MEDHLITSPQSTTAGFFSQADIVGLGDDTLNEALKEENRHSRESVQADKYVAVKSIYQQSEEESWTVEDLGTAIAHWFSENK